MTVYCSGLSLQFCKVLEDVLALSDNQDPLTERKCLEKNYGYGFIEPPPFLNIPWSHGCGACHDECLQVNFTNATLLAVLCQQMSRADNGGTESLSLLWWPAKKERRLAEYTLHILPGT